MSAIFKLTSRPKPELFFKKNDPNDPRLGEVVSADPDDYAASQIVIIGCPQDEGVRRNGGRIGAAQAPDEIRYWFYKLTPFGIDAKIFDAGDTLVGATLEETHDAHQAIVALMLKNGKIVISLGGGNDVSYPDGGAMAKVFGAENWLAFNIDAHFDVRADAVRNSGTPYRQLLDGGLLKPENFAEMAYQPQAASPVYYEYLRQLGVYLKSVEEIKNLELKIYNLFEEFIESRPAVENIFWGFDVDAVRAADAPGVSAPSPIGLSAKEFIALAEMAGKNKKTRLIEFTEVNPNFDIDGRTARLVAIAMQRYCAAAG